MNTRPKTARWWLLTELLLLLAAVGVLEHVESPLLGHRQVQQAALLVLVYVLAMLCWHIEPGAKAQIVRALRWMHRLIQRARVRRTPVQAHYRSVMHLDEEEHT